ncbi:MAG TPA: hypothetical protein PLF40_33920 [Kofleriaceae bacterium]|nr:hypothetical protein [Kofleriaceae bacterium]
MVKGDVVGVDASNIATQVHIGSDDTVVLQGSDGRSVAPATELSAPEKKVETPAAKESSIWDDMVNAIGLGDDAPAEAPAAKK